MTGNICRNLSPPGRADVRREGRKWGRKIIRLFESRIQGISANGAVMGDKERSLRRLHNLCIFVSFIFLRLVGIDAFSGTVLVWWHSIRNIRKTLLYIKNRVFYQDKQSIWCGDISETLNMTSIFLTWIMKKVVMTLIKVGSTGEGFWVKMMDFHFDILRPRYLWVILMDP